MGSPFTTQDPQPTSFFLLGALLLTASAPVCPINVRFPRVESKQVLRQFIDRRQVLNLSYLDPAGKSSRGPRHGALNGVGTAVSIRLFSGKAEPRKTCGPPLETAE